MAGQKTLEDHLEAVPDAVRPIVAAARKAVLEAAPGAAEVAYQSARPRSPSMVWKLARYADDRGWVVGIGALTRHVNLFFYRGRELDPAGELLAGSGADKRSLQLHSRADAERPEIRLLLKRAFELGGARD